MFNESRQHRHSFVSQKTMDGINRPPVVKVTKSTIIVEYIVGEGCCEKDMARRAWATYDSDGNLLGVKDEVRKTIVDPPANCICSTERQQSPWFGPAENHERNCPCWDLGY